MKLAIFRSKMRVYGAKMFLGINGKVLSAGKMDDLVRTARIEELVAESDAPYLGRGNQASSPLTTIAVMVKVAAAKRISLKRTAHIMTANAAEMWFSGRGTSRTFGAAVGAGETGWSISQLVMEPWDRSCRRPSDDWIRSATLDDLRPGRVMNAISRWYRDDRRKQEQTVREICRL